MRKILTSIFILISLMSGCKVTNKVIKNNVSEIRLNEWEFYGEEYYISFSAGKREDPYIIDGKKGKMVEYGVVKLVFYDTENNDKIDKFLLIIGDKEYNIELEQNPFDNSLMGDIKYAPNKNMDISLNITYNGKTESNKLEEFINDLPISNKKALEIFLEEYDNRVNLDRSNLKGEIHISILENVRFNKTMKYWYVSYFGNGKNYTCCIDVKNGEILNFVNS